MTGLPAWRAPRRGSLLLPRLLLVAAAAVAALAGLGSSWLNPASAFCGAPANRGATSRLPRRAAEKGGDEIDDLLESAGVDGKGGGADKGSFDSLMEDAGKFTQKKDRIKRRVSKAGGTELSTLTIEDDIQGPSISDEYIKEIELFARARAPAKLDTSFQGRVAAWAAETWELIRNPTPLQLTYAGVLGGSIILCFAAGFLTWSLGLIRIGDPMDATGLKLMSQDKMVQRYRAMAERKRELMDLDDIRSTAYPLPKDWELQPEAYSIPDGDAPSTAYPDDPYKEFRRKGRGSLITADPTEQTTPKPEEPIPLPPLQK